MTKDTLDVRVLLLVEDNEGDADIVREIMSEADREAYRILHAKSLKEAIAVLRESPIDVIVLDLRLPDCEGVQSVRTLHNLANGTPIVVLTGAEDNQLAVACMDAGAQDYLEKNEMRARTLRRAIGYAISRIREAQVRELRQMLDRYRAMSSASQTTSVTALLAGSGPVHERSPGEFEAIVHRYRGLIEPFLIKEAPQIDPPHAEMEVIVTHLGDLNAGPRDLLDVHLEALNRAVAGQGNSEAKAVVFEARLLALQMMGLLVEFYRVGQRRLVFEGTAQ